MKNEFNKRFDQLEKKREHLFSELKNHSEKIINKKPAPDKWSVAEVMMHLIKGEEASLMFMQKKAADTSKANTSGMIHRLKYALLNIAFHLPLKFKAPGIILPKTEFISLQELEKKWKDIRKRIRQLTDQLPEADFKKELWLHPNTGKMDLLQMIRFTTMHFDRHREQIDRTLKSVAH